MQVKQTRCRPVAMLGEHRASGEGVVVEGGPAGAGDPTLPSDARSEYDVMILLPTPSTEMVRSPGFLG